MKVTTLPAGIKGRIFTDDFYDDTFIEEIDDFDESLSYLEPRTNHGGGGLDFDGIGAIYGKGKRAKYITVGDEFRKSAGCGKTALKFQGVDSGVDYWKFIFCYRWICEKCGSKGGRIHAKRFSRLLKRLVQKFKEKSYTAYEGDSIDTTKGVFDLRQFVFTLPMEIRKYFITKSDIQAFNRICERLINKLFPGHASIRYFHGFGDKDKGVFAPHVNIHVFEFEKEILKLTPEEMKDIKERYVKALKAYIRQVHIEAVPESVWKKIDFHYSFLEGDKIYQRRVFDKESARYRMIDVEGLKLIFHRVEYMSRPCPGYANVEALKGQEYFLRLFVVEMKGFHYITNCGSWKIKDGDRKEEKEEMESLAGERLRIAYDNDGHLIYVSRTDFDLLYIEKDYEELSEGFFRITRKGKVRRSRHEKTKEAPLLY